MSKLQQNLRENKNKIKRDKFLSALDSTFSDFLKNAEFSSDISCVKFAAFPTRDKITQVKTTTRGEMVNWNNFTFKTWQELIAALKRFQQVKNYIGWFFIDIDGPYYKVSVNALLAYISSISDYGSAHEHFDFGWVGDEDDVGIVIGHDHSSVASNEFMISVWGI